MTARVCLICHFSTNDDDQWVTSGERSAICVRCWTREVGIPHPVPAGVAREVSAILASITSWIPEQ